MLSQVFGKLEGFAWTGRGMFPATAQHVEVSFHVGNLQLPRPGWVWWFFWWDPPCVAGKHLGGAAPPIFGNGNPWLIHPWLMNMEGSIWVANDHLYHLLGYCTPIDKPWLIDYGLTLVTMENHHVSWVHQPKMVIFQGRPKSPLGTIQKITFNYWNLAQFFCSSLNYCLA